MNEPRRFCELCLLVFIFAMIAYALMLLAGVCPP